MSSSRLIVVVAVFLLLTGNVSLFRHVLAAYPPSLHNLVFVLSLAVVFACVNVVLLSALCFRVSSRHATTKAALIIVLIASALAAYFMDTYQVVIDDLMIDNIFKTDSAEAGDLLGARLILYLSLLGILPAVLVYRVKIVEQKGRRALWSRLRLALAALAIAVATMLVLGNYYASFFREHKNLRYYANPSYYVYSLIKYAGRDLGGAPAKLQALGLDATIPADDGHRELIVLVVGETARADHFSLNGYQRDTNPLLAQEDVISFRNTHACGTSTAVSVPCMFSIYDHASYSRDKALATENLLDIAQRAGVNVIWLDNNSDSKGVATRVPYVSYKSSEQNPVCDIECRDEGMLSHLQDYIDSHPVGDIFIILHQMGNHGPAYYKRYPAAFEKFTPTCQTNQLEECAQEQTLNTYDNAILYTDYFLSRVINLLKANDNGFEAMMFYISDHGESLGENGLYLHGLPELIAPDAQTHVPMIMWFGNGFDLRNEIHYDSLGSKIDQPFSHDNVFHTLLGLMEIETDVYDASKDIFHEPVAE